MTQVIAIASGKGGVGKSTLAAGLSAALSEKGKKVLAVDCDAGMRNLDLLLGLEGMGVYNMNDVLSGAKELEEAITTHPHHKNLDFLPASSQFDDPLITAPNILGLLRQAQEYDFIIMDCGAGIGRLHKEIAQVCTTLIIVATPEYTSIRDADRTAQVLAANKMRLVINKIDPVLIKTGKFSNIDEIIDATSVQLLGIVPEDGDIRILNNEGKPVCDENTKGGRAICNIACRLCAERRPLYKFW